ncbi:MAG: hypothetical protein EU551_02005 [Promethearchaeota archaeon]|nr:MAG: hypothetical protein EU551_02005 [Candidatus Lokiarchaeota archaeon]
MNNRSYTDKLIEDFLAEVDEKLPSWLKIDPSESEEVLRELREHIEDKANAISESGKSYEEAVRLAIFEMGEPSKIANEYKKRGTPKYFISEELFPTYLTTIKYVFSILAVVISVLTIVGTISDFLTGGIWWVTLFSGVQGLILWLILAFAGISVIFVYFSMEGYYPDDLRAAFKSKEELEKERRKKEKAIKEISKAPGVSPRRKIPKGYKKPGELIAGGIFGLIFSILFIWQPFTYINSLLDPLFLNILAIFGVFWTVGNVMELMQGIGSSWAYVVSMKIFMPTRAIIELISLSIWGLLLVNPQVFPIFWWTPATGWVVGNILVSWYWIYYLVGVIIILAIIGTSINAIHKAIKLKEEDLYK